MQWTAHKKQKSQKEEVYSYRITFQMKRMEVVTDDSRGNEIRVNLAPSLFEQTAFNLLQGLSVIFQGVKGIKGDCFYHVRTYGSTKQQKPSQTAL